MDKGSIVLWAFFIFLGLWFFLMYFFQEKKSSLTKTYLGSFFLSAMVTVVGASILLVGFSSPQQTVSDHQQEMVSQLKGSLIQSHENSPNAFYDMVVNQRPQFSNQVQESGGLVEQLISNNNNTLVIKAYWKKDQDIWQCYKVLFVYTKQIDSDSFQVAMRFPFRFIDNEKIEDKIFNPGVTPVRLSNGAIVSSYTEGDAKLVLIN